MYTLILLINQKFGSVRFGRTLGSEFGRTELTFEMCRTEPNCSAEKFGRTEPNIRFTTKKISKWRAPIFCETNRAEVPFIHMQLRFNQQVVQKKEFSGDNPTDQ